MYSEEFCCLILPNMCLLELFQNGQRKSEKVCKQVARRMKKLPTSLINLKNRLGAGNIFSKAYGK